MRIALLRHGIAADGPIDFERRLTAEGAAEVDRVARTLAALGWAPGSIFHSPLYRAVETARLVHRCFPRVPIREARALAEGGPEEMLATVIGAENPLLVGHHPTLGELAATLLGAKGILPLEKAGVALFEIDAIPLRRPARLIYFAPPSRPGALAG